MKKKTSKKKGRVPRAGRAPQSALPGVRGELKTPAMARPLKARLSLRIDPDLEEFLREKARKDKRRYTTVVEEVIATGALAHGYEPKVITGDMGRFAEVVAGMVIDHLEKKKGFGKGQGK